MWDCHVSVSCKPSFSSQAVWSALFLCAEALEGSVLSGKRAASSSLVEGISLAEFLFQFCQ